MFETISNTDANFSNFHIDRARKTQYLVNVNVNVIVNVICLPTEHQGAQRTRSNVAVHSQIELEFENVGF